MPGKVGVLISVDKSRVVTEPSLQVNVINSYRIILTRYKFSVIVCVTSQAERYCEF